MPIEGTTGTGLDRAITLIAGDYGLNSRISGADIREGAAAADGMNGLIVEAIQRLGLTTDGEITTSDVYSINAYLRARHLDSFTALHGDDEGGAETGFHAVQGDGGVTRLFDQAAVDTVLDGLYHIAFRIENGRFVNEDGNANASVEDVAQWLNEFLAPELSAGTLANTRADPQVHGTTGTGLDDLIERLVDDAGLNHRLSQRQINEGVAAADGMARIVVDAIRATGVADDGALGAYDMIDLNRWIAANRASEWTALHGDDENGVETGLHLIQGDGGRTYLFGEKAVDTIADGIFHLGFAITGDRFANEDGNANARLADVADWLSLLLADDLRAGTLASGHAGVDPASLAADQVYRRAAIVSDNGTTGAVDVGQAAATRVASGTIALDFTANHPDDGRTHAIISKDGATNRAGDFTVYINDGQLFIVVQDGSDTHWIKAEDVTIEAGRQYSLAINFGPGGIEVWLGGTRVAVDLNAAVGLDANTRALVIGGSTWGRDASRPDVIWDHFDGTVANVTVYDRSLDRFEIGAINHSGSLPADWTGTPALTGEQPAVLSGTGLSGEIFDRGTSFNSIDDLVSQAATSAASHHFTANIVDFGGHDEVSTLGEFLGSNAALTDGGAQTAMTTLGIHLTGYVWLEAGSHLLTVRSDDGFLLSLGGDQLSSYAWGRGFSATSKTIEIAEDGLYAVDLYYFENTGAEGLRLELDGAAIGADRLYASLADYQSALAEHGAMPDGGLPSAYDGPVGTTGTGLDQLVRMIGEDEGLANRISAAQIAEGAAAADAINHMIVDAVSVIGALADGSISVSETYDISDYIRAHHYDAFVAAHGDDENGVETGFHLVQGDGGTSYLFGDDAVNTVMDGIYHIGFATVADRFANEDGNANARVETVAYWLNALLGTAPLPPPGPGSSPLLGSAAQPNVTVSSGLNARLAAGALNLTLTGTASNAAGNDSANRLTGNDFANQLFGGKGNDTLRGGEGDDTLVGGEGADDMSGGNGNDTYWIDNAADVIRESGLAGSGNDTVVMDGAIFATYTLAIGLENFSMTGNSALRLTGNGAANRLATGGGADRIDGGGGADDLDGGTGNDTMFGGLGNDWIDGGEGQDVLVGGAGSDGYMVDNAADRIAELAGEGRDHVHASVNWTLGANLEDLTLTGMALRATGNALDNGIDGNGMDNTIDGGRGSDRMAGAGGDDTYIIDNLGDRVVEMSGQGNDTVRSSVAFALGGGTENLVLTGNANLAGTGNSLANLLTGNDGNNALTGLGGDDRISGGLGNDRLTGGLGGDRLTGGAGSDRFIFADLAESTVAGGGRDMITDFSQTEGDLIDLRLIDANASAAGNQAFHLVSALDGTAGALAMTVSGANRLIVGDVDGDGAADFAIVVAGSGVLSAADFLL